MIIAHVYKLEPSESQSSTMSNWLSMLCAQYNFRLAERISAYEQTKIEGAYCDIRTKTERMPIACSLSKYALHGDPFKTDQKTGLAKKRSGFEIQCADLVNLKQSRPWYGGIYSIVLQQMLRQLDAAYKNFFEKGRVIQGLKEGQSIGHSPTLRMSNLKAQRSICLELVGWVITTADHSQMAFK